jgi:hypothetical protein
MPFVTYLRYTTLASGLLIKIARRRQVQLEAKHKSRKRPLNQNAQNTMSNNFGPSDKFDPESSPEPLSFTEIQSGNIPIELERDAPFPVARCARLLLWLWKDAPEILPVAVLQLFAGVPTEHAVVARWEEIDFEKKTFCPDTMAGLVTFPLRSAFDWLWLLRRSEATRPMLDTATPPILLWMRLLLSASCPLRFPKLYHGFRAYCEMPARPEAKSLPEPWATKVRLYARKGEWLQRMTPQYFHPVGKLVATPQ